MKLLGASGETVEYEDKAVKMISKVANHCFSC